MAASPSPPPPAARQLCALLLGGILTLYGSLAVVPFYWLGIHRQPVESIHRGAFDPKRYAPFAYDGPGYWLHSVSVLLVYATPVLTSGVVLILAYLMVRQWRSSAWPSRLASIGLVLLGLSALWFLGSPTGRLIGVWHFD